MNPDRPEGVTLPQFAAAFVPFALLTTAALVAPELGRALDLGRTRYTIWATTVLLIPALTLYPFRSLGRRTANAAHLFWTAALAAYLFHVWWAVVIVLGGIGETFRAQGAFIAGTNFFLTAWWVLDALLLWAVRHPAKPLIWARLAARVFVFLVFAVTLLVLREDVRTFGIVFVVPVVGAALVRALVHTPAPEAAS